MMLILQIAAGVIIAIMILAAIGIKAERDERNGL